MKHSLEKVFKAMQEQGWCIDNVKNLTPNKEWQILLKYHLSVLESLFIDYHYENKDKITDIHMEAIGFITDFIHAFRGENYGE
jgi:hypothetical protein